jgi:hypothetical protein
MIGMKFRKKREKKRGGGASMKRGKGGFYLSLINLIIYNNSCEKTCTQLILSFTMERRKP